MTDLFSSTDVVVILGIPISSSSIPDSWYLFHVRKIVNTRFEVLTSAYKLLKVLVMLMQILDFEKFMEIKSSP